MIMETPDFYDSTRPAYIPAGALAACYGYGPFAVPVSELARFSGHILINDMPGAPQAARLCRVLDVELGAARPPDAPAHVHAREAHGHGDATVYMSLNNVPAVVDALGELLARTRLWVAWWDRPEVPKPADIVAELATMGCHIDEDRIWAVQWLGGKAFDVSRLYGRDDFVR